MLQNQRLERGVGVSKLVYLLVKIGKFVMNAVIFALHESRSLNGNGKPAQYDRPCLFDKQKRFTVPLNAQITTFSD